jgi:uncharacterized protein YndB with AHSA1/START domain
MNKKTFLPTLAAVIFVVAAIVVYAFQVSGSITVERTMGAPVGEVWKLWTEEASIQQWWGPKDYTAPTIKSDFRDHGRFLFSMKDADGRVFWNTGEYLNIEAYKKIISTIQFSDEQGNVVPASHYGLPGRWPEAVTVIVEFEATDSQNTVVTVREQGLPIIMSFFASMGWNQQLDKFETLLK